jgi:hypothetical protein
LSASPKSDRDVGSGVIDKAAITDAQPAPTLAEHEAEQRRLANLKTKNLLAYGKVYAYGSMSAMGVQILIADAAFYLYGHAYHWKVPVGAMQVWLGATVVQVIGIVLVIAKSLFPEERSPTAN